MWVREGSGAVALEARSGFACRCNPAKLRLFVERALVHDPARRQAFVEASLYPSCLRDVRRTAVTSYKLSTRSGSTLFMKLRSRAGFC